MMKSDKGEHAPINDPPRSFRGREQISRDDETVYELVYHGGLLRT